MICDWLTHWLIHWLIHWSYQERKWRTVLFQHLFNEFTFHTQIKRKENIFSLSRMRNSFQQQQQEKHNSALQCVRKKEKGFLIFIVFGSYDREFIDEIFCANGSEYLFVFLNFSFSCFYCWCCLLLEWKRKSHFGYSKLLIRDARRRFSDG